MSEQYYSIVLQLPKEFMIWVHDHPTVARLKGSTAFGWANHPNIIQHNFGGKHGKQFRSPDDIQVFLNNLKSVFTQWKITSEHLYPLLYIYCFIDDDVEKQSIANNRFNELLEYAKYIINLYAIGVSHINSMKQNSDYELALDTRYDEILFIKKSLLKEKAKEDLSDYIPDEKHADDIVRYTIIESHGEQFYIPKGLDFDVHSSNVIKNIIGETLTNTDKKKTKNDRPASSYYFLKTPTQLRRYIFENTINFMLNEHKRDNTEFYRLFTSETSQIKQFESFYNRNQRHIISNTLTLTRIGALVTAYLNKHKLISSKRQQAYFLHEYFVLLKAFDIKNKEIPNDYEDLKHFYISNKITQEFIRNMMKDVGEI